MNTINKLWIYTFIFLSTLLYADEAGSLSLFTFNNGKPLSGIEILVDAKESYKTDADGSLQIYLGIGKHQIEIFAKDSAGKNLGYFKKPIVIKSEKDTLVTATFTQGNIGIINIDTPLDSNEIKIKSSGSGLLSGIVLSSQDNKPISYARVFVKGTAIDARTDKDGKFTLSIPSDVNLSISVVHSEYSSQTLNNIFVKKNAQTSQEIKLTPASMELEEFVILAPKVKGSIASIMAEEKNSNSISNILSSQEMSKKGDSSAASALKRVTGVTLIGGKDIYVRGLGDRYSNIEMNSMPLPSPDPLKRSVPLDIFPAGAISSMKVQKSATSDVPSSFGGGYVDIRTKDSSKDDYIKISIGANGNTNTGKDVYTYQGSSTDQLGFDNGYRSIDSDILNNSQVVVGQRINGLTTDYLSKESLSKLTQGYVNRNYDVTTQKQAVGFDASVEGAMNFEIRDKHKITLFGNYKYKQDSTSRSEDYYKYDMQKSRGELYKTATQYGTIDKSISEYVHNAMFNIGYNYADVFKLKYTKLYTHNAEKVTKVVNGIMGSNDEDMTKYYLDWEERTLSVDQINGVVDYELFNNETNLRFGAELATAELYQPNNHQYTYRNEGESFLDNKISNSIANSLKSNDELMAFYLKNRFHLNILSENDYIDVGIALSSKERVSKQNKFYLRKIAGGTIVEDSGMTGNIERIYDEFVRADIDYDDRSLLVSQLFKPADYYDAEIDETTAYISGFIKPTQNIELLIGVRYVDFSQIVYQYKEDRENPDMSKRRLIQRIPEQLDVNEIFPSLSLKYRYDEKNHFDFAMSQTYIAPDLREFTSGEYFHPYEVATIVGNPDLVNTDIYSFDLKYAHYFSNTQNIKVGLFYKFLDKPIEDVMIPSSSLPIYSFDNADSASIYGIEIDGRKDFAFIDSSLKNYSISGNISLTESIVSLRAEQESIYSTNNRELQGLSPIVINVTTAYEIKARSVMLSYNKMGKRIRKLGMIDDGDSYPDHYEDPAAILDFVWIERFTNRVNTKIKLGNILQDETIWTQGSNVTKKFNNPMTFSLSLSYKY